MIHLDEQKLKDNGLRKPVPYMAARGNEVLEYRFPTNAAYRLNERDSSYSPNEPRAER